nr:hypothetical protein [uncultured Pseudomonas sp.]
MSLAMTIFSIITAWMSIAISMLWGILRIARRHHPLVQEEDVPSVRWKYLSARYALPFCTRPN